VGARVCRCIILHCLSVFVAGRPHKFTGPNGCCQSCGLDPRDNPPPNQQRLSHHRLSDSESDAVTETTDFSECPGSMGGNHQYTIPGKPHTCGVCWRQKLRPGEASDADRGHDSDPEQGYCHNVGACITTATPTVTTTAPTCMSESGLVGLFSRQRTSKHEVLE
jgi:hypothetical protein